jgi:DNA helicase HerA-like ATPase
MPFPKLLDRIIRLLRNLFDIEQRPPRDNRLVHSDTVRWVRIPIPLEQTTNHFLAAGTTGSGKTTVLRLLMQDALRNVGKGDCRAIVYDAKQDAIPILSAFVPEDRLVIANPYDERGARWEMADDLQEPRQILEVVTILFPKTPDSTQFFHDACVSITYHVLLSFYRSGIRYQFADLIRVLKDYRFIVQVLSMPVLDLNGRGILGLA